jgi:hypothetical protein
MAIAPGNQGGVWTNSQNNPYPQSEFLDKQTKRPTRAWQQFFLGILNFTSASHGNNWSSWNNFASKPSRIY